MKIVKLVKNVWHDNIRYYVMFDEIPELTYERIGSNYIGSAIDSEGNIIASELLRYERWGNAFAGRELSLTMKDGSVQKIKDHWFDCGAYKEHGRFIGIGAGTLESLQDCYVYFSYNINVDTFNKMIDDYLTRDKIYTYDEVREWCRLQYKWYPVIVNGKRIPYMMNEKGDMVEEESKKRVHCRENIMKKVNGKYKTYTYFKFKYTENGRLIKIEANYLNTLKATLPFSEEEIKKKCKIE